jgi:hypothetical protein
LGGIADWKNCGPLQRGGVELLLAAGKPLPRGIEERRSQRRERA